MNNLTAEPSLQSHDTPLLTFTYQRLTTTINVLLLFLTVRKTCPPPRDNPPHGCRAFLNKWVIYSITLL